MDDAAAEKRFRQRFAGFIPKRGWQFARRARIDNKASVGSEPNRPLSEDLKSFREMLRRTWIEPDLRTKEWRVFLLQRKAHIEANPRFLMTEAFYGQLPAPSPWDQALMYLLKAADRARYCGNPDCPAPYFFAKRRSQKYCADACAKPAQQEFKRRWWAEHGKEWRKKRKKRDLRKTKKGKRR